MAFFSFDCLFFVVIVWLSVNACITSCMGMNKSLERLTVDVCVCVLLLMPLHHAAAHSKIESVCVWSIPLVFTVSGQSGGCQW